MSELEDLDFIQKLLKKTHDILDEYNNQNTKVIIDNEAKTINPQCYWCKEIGWDGLGLKHKDDCILIQMRRYLNES